MVLVLVGPSFVGKTTILKRLIQKHYHGNYVSTFLTDTFQRSCRFPLRIDFTSKNINRAIKSRVQEVQAENRLLVIDFGGSCLLDYHQQELQELLECLGDEKKIIHLMPFKDQEKSRTLLHNQVKSFYRDYNSQKHQETIKVILDQIDEALDSELYNQICTEKLYILDQESPMMSNDEYIKKLEQVSDKILSNLENSNRITKSSLVPLNKERSL